MNSRPSSSNLRELYNIYNGDFSNIPEPLPNSIKIFLSSTTKDYRIERDFIIEALYSGLREDCRKRYGYDLTMIDLRWGIRREKALSNTTTQFCINEANKCLKESIGPAFITFISERYGTVMLREEIEKSEFETVFKHTNEVMFNGVNLVEYCYELDLNEIGEKKYYKLKSMEDLLTGFLNKFINEKYKTGPLKNEIEKSEFEIIMMNTVEDLNLISDCYKLDNNYYKLKSMEKIFKNSEISELKEIWKNIDQKLNVTFKNFRDAAKKVLFDYQSKQYFISVTEEEILTGVINNPRANETSLAFFRKINYKDTDKKLMEDKGYLDKEPEYQALLEKIKRKVEDNLAVQNRNVFEIKWNETNGFNKNDQDKKDYLEQFKKRLTEGIHGLILKAIERLDTDIRNRLTEDDHEIIHQANKCKNMMKSFVERNEYTQKILDYVKDEHNDKPFVIYGQSGSGKSSILADAVQKNITQLQLDSWAHHAIHQQYFLYLKSLIYQFMKLFGLKEHEESKNLKDAIEARDYLFDRILAKENEQKQKRFVLLIDSIDQLHESDYHLAWMTKKLPRYVKVVYSTLPEHGGIFSNLKEMIEFKPENYMEIKDLKFTAAIEQLKQKLNGKSRDLQPNQWEFINDCLKQTEKILPLHIKLLCDITIKWRSTYNDIDGILKCVSIKKTIQYLFKRYELHYGPIVFSHVIFYITMFKNGISETELEDILSLDDQALNEVFEKDEPPIRRFPNSILLRVLDSIKEYLTRKQTDDVSVIAWFHRSFYDASKEIYPNIFNPSKERDCLLMNIVDYFNEEWKDKAKEYDWIDGKKGAKPRYTKSQELRHESKIQESDKIEWIYNKRKLNELVNIILLLNDDKKKIECLCDSIYFNYRFVHSKAQLHDLQFIMDNDELINQIHEKVCQDPQSEEDIKKKSKELVEISNLYVNNYGSIYAHPDSILYEIISRASDDVANRLKISVEKNSFSLIPLENGF